MLREEKEYVCNLIILICEVNLVTFADNVTSVITGTTFVF